MKKILCIALSLVVVIGLTPITAFGDNGRVWDNFDMLTHKIVFDNDGQPVESKYVEIGTAPGDGGFKYQSASQFYLLTQDFDIVNPFYYTKSDRFDYTLGNSDISSGILVGHPDNYLNSTITYRGNFSQKAVELVVGLSAFGYDRSFENDADYVEGSYDLGKVGQLYSRIVKVYAIKTGSNKKIEVPVYETTVAHTFYPSVQQYNAPILKTCMTMQSLPIDTEYVIVEMEGIRFWNSLISVLITENYDEVWYNSDYTPYEYPQNYELFDDFTTWSWVNGVQNDTTASIITNSVKNVHSITGVVLRNSDITDRLIANGFGIKSKALMGLITGTSDMTLTYRAPSSLMTTENLFGDKGFGKMAAEMVIPIDEWFMREYITQFYAQSIKDGTDPWFDHELVFKLYEHKINIYAGTSLGNMERVDFTHVRYLGTPPNGSYAFSVVTQELPSDTEYVKFEIKDAYWKDKIHSIRITDDKSDFSKDGCRTYGKGKQIEPEALPPHPAAPSITSIEKIEGSDDVYVHIYADNVEGFIIVGKYDRNNRLIGVYRTSDKDGPTPVNFRYYFSYFTKHRVATGEHQTGYMYKAFFLSNTSNGGLDILMPLCGVGAVSL